MSSRPLRCRNCGDALPVAATTGRPRAYCSDRCRYAARGNTASIPASSLVAPARVDPTVVRRRIAEELAASLDGAEPTAPEDRLAAVLIELRSALSELGRIGPELPPALRARAERLARRVDSALGDTFQEVAYG